MEKSEKKKIKKELHPRNAHRKGYNFSELTKEAPVLAEFVFTNKYGNETIDFSDPEAVKELNRALLARHYGVKHWSIPQGYLCPPVPGRADYVHYLADLLSDGKKTAIPKGPNVRAMDVGTGANLIFPLLGNAAYGWTFIGTETDLGALKSAQLIVDKNKLKKKIALRGQRNARFVFKDIIREDDLIDVIMCNPPFHKSLEDAEKGTRRKWRNLGKPKEEQKDLNFGGKSNEIVFPGGEIAFISQMMDDSKYYRDQVLWFSTLVARKDHLPAIQRKLKKIRPTMSKVVEMSQGQKNSRFIAWTFMNKKQQFTWKESRWKK